jgi:hypothetical protein
VGASGELVFQNGGVLEGSGSDAMANIINNILASNMNEQQVSTYR